MRMLPADAPVELLHWPAQAESRPALARNGVPCLLLVAAGAGLPGPIAPTEDWVRLPADERDVAARAQALCLRLARSAAEPPRVADGVVTHGERRAELTDAEATALALLLDAGGVVSREELTDAVWPHGAQGSRSLEALVYRLRVRLADVNIHVRTVRGRGYVVDAGPIAASRAEDAP
jgi:hypothetical protein